MENHEVQQQLFGYLKNNLPSHLSLVDDLCDLLDLSADSVYRRIRGEKPISLSELKKICEHYHVSLDQVMQLQNESVIFHAPGVNGSSFATHADYLKAILAQFKFFNTFKTGEIQYLCKDAPLWYFYFFPEMAAFKTFFYSKTIGNQPSLRDTKFSLKEYPFTECFEIGQQILQEHSRLNSVELWNLESIHSTINQIAYYRDAGVFKSEEDLNAVIDSFHSLLDHLRLQAEHGVKFMSGASDLTHRGSLQLYVNELILGNNTILLNLDGQRISVLVYGVLNYLMTRDDRFSAKSFESFNTLMSRSTLVSKTGEKERQRFFNVLREKVNGLRK